MKDKRIESEEFDIEVVKVAKDAVENNRPIITMVNMGEGKVTVLGGNTSPIGIIEMLINTLLNELDDEPILSEIVYNDMIGLLTERKEKHGKSEE